MLTVIVKQNKIKLSSFIKTIFCDNKIQITNRKNITKKSFEDNHLINK